MISETVLTRSSIGALHQLISLESLRHLARRYGPAEIRISEEVIDEVITGTFGVAQRFTASWETLRNPSTDSSAKKALRESMMRVFLTNGKPQDPTSPEVVWRLMEEAKKAIPHSLQIEMEPIIRILTARRYPRASVRRDIECRLATWTTALFRTDEERMNASTVADIYRSSQRVTTVLRLQRHLARSSDDGATTRQMDPPAVWLAPNGGGGARRGGGPVQEGGGGSDTNPPGADSGSTGELDLYAVDEKTVLIWVHDAAGSLFGLPWGPVGAVISAAAVSSLVSGVMPP